MDAAEQARLNRALVEALLDDDSSTASALLDQGVDPNATHSAGTSTIFNSILPIIDTVGRIL